jgi:mRNA interferase MazF
MTRRGSFVTVAAPGDYGKPRPALVVQSDYFEELPSITICPLTSELKDDAGQLRIDVAPDETNGLRKKSQIAVDKITTVRVERVGAVIGCADDALMMRVTRAMALFLGIA